MPSPPAWMTAGGETGVVTKVGDYEVKFTFKEPHGLFLQWLASWRGDAPVLFAKHFFSQFHPAYNPDGIDALVAESGLENWVALFQSKGGSQADSISHWQTTEAPRLYAWVLTQPFGFGTRVVAERNPYYFKVDTEGNQLPYLDRVTFEVLEDPQVLLAKVIGGEIDFMDRHVFNSTNKSVIAEYRETGDYRFIDEYFTKMNTAIISLNLTNEDPVKREIFRNKDFRIGLSHAINRQEIIDIIYIGQGEPWQAAPMRETPYFHERLATQYLEYDIDLANQYLDKAFPERDGEGFRLGPDGKRISFTIELPAAFIPELVDVAEIVQRHWREVGVDMQINAIDRALYHTRELSNQQDGGMFWGDGGFDAMMDPRYYFPYNNFSTYAPAWAGWFDPSGATNSVEGSEVKIEEPPAATQRQMELYRQIKATADTERQFALLREILEIAADEFYVIGISTLPEGYGIAKNGFRNVPQRILQGGAYYLTPAPTNPSQYFWEQG
jgi:peptide/nickel transport system substrate-binding protein